MTFWSYMLECFKDGKSKCYYTGQTGNLRRRVGQHIGNVRHKRTKKFTGRFDFVKLVWAERCKSREDALDLERTVKGLTYKQKRRVARRKRRA